MKRYIPSVLLPCLMCIFLLSGSANIPAADVWHAIWGQAAAGSTADVIISQVRLPQMLAGTLAGAALAVAGLVMQTVFANPLADPSLLGVNAGAGLGAAVAMLVCGGGMVAGSMTLAGGLFIVICAGAGAVAVVMLLLVLSSLFRSNLQLLVAGVMVSFATSGVIAILSSFASSQGLQSYVFWGMGSFSGIASFRLLLFAAFVVAGIAGIRCLGKTLNALLLGSAYATTLGIRVRRARTCLLLLAGILCAVVTAFCGPLAFIGLAAPHLAGLSHGTAAHRQKLAVAAVWGSILSLVAALLARSPGGIQLPLNAVTPLLGVPVIMWLLLRRQ